VRVLENRELGLALDWETVPEKAHPKVDNTGL
jgi:hypothetical protein